jgi:hypothetical protein
VYRRQETRPLLEVVDEQPILCSGRAGVRAWGGSVSLDGLAVRAGADGSGEWVKPPPDGAAPGERALQALCLVILNLNEVVYVD